MQTGMLKTMRNDGRHPGLSGRLWVICLLVGLLGQLRTLPVLADTLEDLDEVEAPECGRFDAAALAARAQVWQKRVNAMPVADVILWITGQAVPPISALDEVRQHLNCLRKAWRIDPAGGDGAVTAPVVSHYRNYATQADTWVRKYYFSGRAFGRISSRARARCAGLISVKDRAWNPARTDHRRCWLGEVAGTAVLGGEARQYEILQTSAPPGMSRHHWGTDVDLFDARQSATHWSSTGQFAPVYAWLQEHAMDFGFFQPYQGSRDASANISIEERWHWSYYPVAHALLEFARRYPTAINRKLARTWGGEPALSTLPSIWHEYVFNISNIHTDY